MRQGRQTTRVSHWFCRIPVLALIVTTWPLLSALSDNAVLGDRSLSSAIAALFHKDRVTIVITDSGLGGLSVAAAIEQRLRDCSLGSKVDLVYANALPDNEHLYNRMPDLGSKARVFSSALSGFTQKYHPDIILIACNTLSVVYPATEFASTGTVPVAGIVDFGVAPLREELESDSSKWAIIMGTPTTIQSEAHQRGLEQSGIPANRIVTQACEDLESEIQTDPASDIVNSLISMYVQEALSKRGPENRGEAVVALCCTHYGYARKEFDSAFHAQLGYRVAIVDPNEAMANAFSDGLKCESDTATTVAVTVASRAKLTQTEIDAVAELLQSQSPATASALRHYTYDTTLFEFTP